MDRQALLEWCRKKTNNPELKDELDFAMVLDKIEGLLDSVGITSESIAGDLSQSFGQDAHKDIMVLLSPYRKAKFL